MIVCASILWLNQMAAVHTETTTASPSVHINLGRIVGTALDIPTDAELSHRTTRVNAFLGVPYAVPPVGDLRFKPPVVSQSLWNADEPFDATRLGNRCPQVYSDAFPVSGEYDEDCLNLDIYVPVPTVSVSRADI